jgi:hypothetical protein
MREQREVSGHLSRHPLTTFDQLSNQRADLVIRLALDSSPDDYVDFTLNECDRTAPEPNGRRQ